MNRETKLADMVRELIAVYWGEGDRCPENPPDIVVRAKMMLAEVPAQAPKASLRTRIICDVWGGDYSTEHVARYFVESPDDPRVKAELANFYLVNLRCCDNDSVLWGPHDEFDERVSVGRPQ